MQKCYDAFVFISAIYISGIKIDKKVKILQTKAALITGNAIKIRCITTKDKLNAKVAY